MKLFDTVNKSVRGVRRTASKSAAYFTKSKNAAAPARRNAALTVFAALALMLAAALIFTGCKQPAAPEPTPAPPAYTTVAYAKLAEYLQKLPEGTATHYIEVTGLTEDDLQGEPSSHPAQPSPLGKILNANPTKKVALKFGDIAYLRDMRYCFWLCQSLVQVAAIPEGVKNLEYCFTGCGNLVSVAVIPESVTNMKNCFDGCEKLTHVSAIPASVTNMEYCLGGCKSLTAAPEIRATSLENMSFCFIECKKLTKAPVIPASVKDMSSCFTACESLKHAPEIPQGVQNMDRCFGYCTALTSVVLKCNYINGKFLTTFKDCTSLGVGSIKVPHGQLTAYTNHATEMGAQASWFAEE